MVGLAAFQDGDLAGAVSVRCFPGEVERSFRERVAPEMARLTGGPYTLALERPPPTALASANHGHQARIGDAIGYMSGLMAYKNVMAGRLVLRPSVSFWRAAMFVHAARYGLLLEKPRPKLATVRTIAGTVHKLVRVVDGGLGVTWRGCDHVLVFEDYSALQAGTPDGCPECEASTRKAGPRGMTADEWKRDEWKRIACLFVGTLWPEFYGVLLAGPRERAKSVKPDHRYAGVSDACEAVGIAVSVLVATH